MAEPRSKSEPGLVACSLLLRLGFIGATASAAGLLQCFDHETPGVSALTLTFFGAVLSVASWRRGLAVLEHAEPVRSAGIEAEPEPTSITNSRLARRGIATGPAASLRSVPKYYDFSRPTAG